MGQTTSVTTTYFALDVMGLPEVIYTTEGNLYLHLPGVIMAESGTGDVRYLLSDGLGSVRQAVDESGDVVVYQAFDPYGNPVQDDSSPYGFTGEWWESDVSLLHLRARWYAPEMGTFLNKDSWEGSLRRPQTFGGYNYTYGNPVNFADLSGFDTCANYPDGNCPTPPRPPHLICENTLFSARAECMRQAAAIQAEMARQRRDRGESISAEERKTIIEAYDRVQRISQIKSRPPKPNQGVIQGSGYPVEDLSSQVLCDDELDFWLLVSHFATPSNVKIYY